MSRFLIYSALAVLSFLIGGTLSFLWTSRMMIEDSQIMLQVYSLGEYETLTSLQYQQADSAHGKQALADLLDFMQHVDATEGNRMGRSLEIDRAITYTRMALVEAREDNKKQYKRDIERAQESFAKRSGTVMSEAALLSLVAKQDADSHYALPAVFSLRQAKK